MSSFVPPTKTIAIAGFTSKLARLITTSLLTHHPTIKIHGLVRTLSKVPQPLLSHPRIKIFETSSTDIPSIRNAISGSEILICCYLGPQNLMVDGQKILIDAAVEEGVKRYMCSDWSLDFRGLRVGDHPVKDPMKIVQGYLEGKEEETGGKIKGVHVLIGAFMEILWGMMVREEGGVFKYWGSGDEKLEATCMDDVGRYTAEVAADDHAVGFLNFLGDRKSVKELAQIYQDRYEGEISTHRLGSLEELHGIVKDSIAKEPRNPSAWRKMAYQYWMWSGKTDLENVMNDRYPDIKPLTNAEFLKKHSKESLVKSYWS